MKGDIGFVGFMLTADEWEQLDADSRAALIAVATRRMEALTPPPIPPRRMPEGTGKHEVLDIIEADLDDLLEPDADMEAAIREDEASSAVPENTGDFEDFSDWAEL